VKSGMSLNSNDTVTKSAFDILFPDLLIFAVSLPLSKYSSRPLPKIVLLNLTTLVSSAQNNY
jgi:hypothetical protein